MAGQRPEVAGYTTLHPIKHNGRFYPAGEQLGVDALSAEDADPLLAVGAVAAAVSLDAALLPDDDGGEDAGDALLNAVTDSDAATEQALEASAKPEPDAPSEPPKSPRKPKPKK